jgi:hypothetical protein
MPTVSITWVTSHDDNVCPICKAIDGFTWTFENEVPDSLVHPTYGEVWNIQLGSLAHEHQLHRGSKYGLISSCRCHTESKLTSLRDLADEVRRLKNEVKTALGEEISVNDTVGGSSRKTTAEDIGIDLSKYGIE